MHSHPNTSSDKHAPPTCTGTPTTPAARPDARANRSKRSGIRSRPVVARLARATR